MQPQIKKRMERELVSVIMPTYNASKYLADSIESILAQTYTNLELVITDDGSTDTKTLEILRNYSEKDSRVRVFYLEKNMGAGPARNNSIKEARGRYIAFCDSDDNWMPEKLEKQLAFLEECRSRVTYSSYIMCDEKDNEIGLFIPPRKITYYGMLRDDKMGFSTCIYDAKTIGKKYYMPSLRKRQDWAMVINLMKHCRVAYGMKEPLVYYRIRSNSISRNKLALVRFNTKVYQEVLGFSKFKSYLYFSFLFLPTYSIKLIRKKIDSWLFNHNMLYKQYRNKRHLM